METRINYRFDRLINKERHFLIGNNTMPNYFREDYLTRRYFKNVVVISQKRGNLVFVNGSLRYMMRKIQWQERRSRARRKIFHMVHVGRGR